MRHDAADPAFSVVIPCRDEADTLAACLDGLACQDYPARRVEVIVVDGGSTDGSQEIARAAGARVLRDGANGPSEARNVGIRAARAPVVAFTDADCVPRFDWLTRFAEVFAERPGIAGVAGAIRLPRGTLRGMLEDDDAQASYHGYITSNVAYRQDVLLEMGGFSEELVCAEDYDLAWRAMDAGHRVVHDPRPVVTHFPPELKGPALRYLRKQFWYARHDVPTYVRALRRARDPRSMASASFALVLDGAATVPHALCVATACGGLVARAPALVAAGVAGTGLVAAQRVVRAARRVGEPPRVVPALVGLAALKGLARGAGTLAGLADLAKPSARRALRPRGGASWAPSAPPSPRPSRRSGGSLSG